jgi:hypothetical protein
VTATAATNGYQQRSATAHNTPTISATLAYATPEKRTVEDQCRWVRMRDGIQVARPAGDEEALVTQPD